MIKEKNGWWYLVDIGCFYAYPFPTHADAAEALTKLKEPDHDKLPRHDVLSVQC